MVQGVRTSSRVGSWPQLEQRLSGDIRTAEHVTDGRAGKITHIIALTSLFHSKALQLGVYVDCTARNTRKSHANLLI